MATTPILLASASPRRAALLEEAGIAHEVSALGAVDERVPVADDGSQLPPEEVVVRLALRKVRAAARRAPDRYVLAADTLVFLAGAALGKPADEAEAADMLRRLSGRSHEVATGVALRAPSSRGAREATGSRVTRVTFRALAESEIAAYVASGEPLDKAGGYGIQGGARAFVERLDGDLDTVIGLPVGLVRDLLARV